jgi:hypothetical protein
MPASHERMYWSDAVARGRAWWDASTFVGDVALLFFVVTVGNSVMMLTGLDEPKTGSFAYVHLLGRLGIITVVVALFHADELAERGRPWLGRVTQPDRANRPPRSRRTAVDGVVASVLRGGVEGSARVFTAVVTVICLLTVAFAQVRPPAGGSGLYRNLVVFAAVLLPVMLVASRSWRRRRNAGPSPSP